MDDATMVTAGIRIGSALGSGVEVEWDEVFDAMALAVPELCAVQLTGWDPASHSFMVVAERGYQQAISHDLAYQLPRTRWGGQLFAAGRPLLMDDMPHNFRDSPHYQERLRPAGLEDGLSTALWVGAGHHVGVLHLNAPVRQAFGEPTREFVSRLAPALARGVNPLGCPRFDATFGPEWAVSRLVPGDRPLEVTGRAPSPLAADPQIVALGEVFGGLAVGSVAFVWPSPDGWYRVRLLQVTDHRGGILVASTRFANEFGLTAREVDVATGIVAGLSNQAIAERLVVSRRTVETYVERLLGKLDCLSRGEAAGIAARAGLIRPNPQGGVGDLARLTRGAGPDWF